MEQHEMDADGLTSLALTESDLINLQQAGVLVTNQGTPHFTQTDLETLASIQDDLETFNIDASQEEIVDIADLAKDVGGQFSISDEHLSGYESGLGLDMNLVSSIGSQNIAQNIGNETTDPPEAELPDRQESGQMKTIQIVRATGSGFNKLKLANTTSSQQIRIQPASAVRVSSGQATASSNQQLKFVNIFPQSKPKEGQVVNILNSDGSISSITLPGSQENVQVLNSDGSITFHQGLQLPGTNQSLQIGTVPPSNLQINAGTSQPLQVPSGTSYQIAGSQTLQLVGSSNQTVQLAGSAGSAIQLAAGANQTIQLTGAGAGAQVLQVGQVNSGQFRSGLSSGSRIAGTGNQQQTVKLISTGGQSYRVISGGKIAGDQSPRKPVSPFKPEQGQLLRTADGKLLAFTSGKKLVLNNTQASSMKAEKPVTQVIRLQPDSSNATNKLQFVRVVNSQGESQTVQIKLPDKNKSNVLPIPGLKKVNSGGSVQTSIQKEIAQAKKELISVETQGLRPRKPCNCTKSQCLKLYCDCFANGEFCYNCNCTNCHNNLENEEERQRSIRQCLDRNPNAFRPKIGKNPSESDRRHNKGCNCKRSGCLKNYCECYEAKIICTDICKCVGCKNVDERTGTKVASFNYVEEMPDESLSVSEKWFKPTSSLRSKLLQAPNLNLQDVSVKKAPFSFVTQEVVEATCQCLLAQAEDGEKEGLPESQIERQVLEEFGRCLSQIIDFASKTKQ